MNQLLNILQFKILKSVTTFSLGLVETIHLLTYWDLFFGIHSLMEEQNLSHSLEHPSLFLSLRMPLPFPSKR